MPGMSFRQWFGSFWHMLGWLWATRGRADVPTDRDLLPICPNASGDCQPTCMAPGAEGLRTKCRILYSHLFFDSAPFSLRSSKVQFVDDGSGKPDTRGHNPFDHNSKSLVCLKWGFTNWLTYWKSFNILLSQNRLTSVRVSQLISSLVNIFRNLPCLMLSFCGYCYFSGHCVYRDWNWTKRDQF